MPGLALMPTITHRVRSFLRSRGANIAPWSGLDETYAELHRVLFDRRDDPTLWGPLAELLRDLVACVTDPEAGRLAAPNAELLAAWDIDALVRELQAALGNQNPATAPSLAGFLGRLTAPVLGGFLLLGLVAGCGGRLDTATTDATGGSRPTDAGVGAGGQSGTGGRDAGMVDAEPPVDRAACAADAADVLTRTVAQSPSLEAGEKELLCRCLAALNASWTDGLTELFATQTDEVIAAALEEMIQCCTGERGNDFVRDRFLDGSLCIVARPYKGVSLPER